MVSNPRIEKSFHMYSNTIRHTIYNIALMDTDTKPNRPNKTGVRFGIGTPKFGIFILFWATVLILYQYRITDYYGDTVFRYLASHLKESLYMPCISTYYGLWPYALRPDHIHHKPQTRYLSQLATRCSCKDVTDTGGKYVRLDIVL